MTGKDASFSFFPLHSFRPKRVGTVGYPSDNHRQTRTPTDPLVHDRLLPLFSCPSHIPHQKPMDEADEAQLSVSPDSRRVPDACVISAE